MLSLARARTGLATGLFPFAARPRRSLSRAVPLAVLMVLVVTAIELLRLPGDASVNTIWAEDGSIFLQGAKQFGRLGAAFHTYNGYVHLAPRLVAAVVASFPLAAAAALFAVISALSVGLVALFVFVASRDHVPSPWWRLALCASLALMPVAVVESLDNSANLQWYLMAGAFWALLWRPYSRTGKVAQLVICMLAAASEPLAALLLPVAAARMVATRSPKDQAPTLGLLAGLALQLAVGTVSPQVAVHPGIPLLGRLYALRVLLPAVTGDRGMKSLFLHDGWAPAYLVAAVLIATACVWVAWRRVRGAAWLMLGFAGTSVLAFAVPVYLRWGPDFNPRSGSAQELSTSGRYTIVPIFLVYSLAACAFGGRWGQLRWRWGRAALVAAAAAVLVTTWTLDFSAQQNLRVTATRWDRALAVARATCLASPGLASTTVDISPPHWKVELPCREIVQTSGGT